MANRPAILRDGVLRRAFRIRLAGALTLVLAAGPSPAHDPYDTFLTPFGEPCCGVEDCAPLAEGDVAVVADGYFIHSRREFVPMADAQLGPDDRYHLCAFKGLRMCFLVPRAGM